MRNGEIKLISIALLISFKKNAKGPFVIYV